MDNRYTVTALDRAVDILERLAQSTGRLGLADLARETGIPKSTLFRILLTLQERRCVVFDKERNTYRLGLKLWELGNAFLRQSDLQEAASHYMRQLADTCGESIFLGTLDRGEVIYVRCVESPKSAVVVRKLGQRAPAYCTATGLAMLAFLPGDETERHLDEQELQAFTKATTTDRALLHRKMAQVRQTRVAVVDGEYNPALLCLASPVLDETGRPVAALTAALLSDQANDDHVGAVRQEIKRAAQSLSRECGYLEGSSPGTGLSYVSQASP